MTLEIAMLMASIGRLPARDAASYIGNAVLA